METQKVFQQIVSDSIINYDTATWINNMNITISSTNVILNVAISPSLWLIPSSLIILKNPIEGYNNKLKVSNENMKFGINKNLNYYGEEKKLNGISPKNKILSKISFGKKLKGKNSKPKTFSKKNSEKTSSNSENIMILSFAIAGGILISKYIF